MDTLLNVFLNILYSSEARECSSQSKTNNTSCLSITHQNNTNLCKYHNAKSKGTVPDSATLQPMLQNVYTEITTHTHHLRLIVSSLSVRSFRVIWSNSTKVCARSNSNLIILRGFRAQLKMPEFQLPYMLFVTRHEPSSRTE